MHHAMYIYKHSVFHLPACKRTYVRMCICIVCMYTYVYLCIRIMYVCIDNSIQIYNIYKYDD